MVDLGPFSDNNHEEADTLMICLGVFAAERHSKKAQVTFFHRIQMFLFFLLLILTAYQQAQAFPWLPASSK